MTQLVLTVEALPESAIEASAAFITRHLAHARKLAGETDTSALAIVLPPAPSDHDDWRCTLARDLARAHAPVRVNVIGGAPGEDRDDTITFLASAPGITGQYFPVETRMPGATPDRGG